MPIGSYASVPYLVQQLIAAAPRRVLDLGMGFGGNGVLVRQWLDLGAQPWKTFLAGVEVWADYRNPTWDLYDLVIVDTIENYFQRYAEPFDLVLFTEVIEHFDKLWGTHALARPPISTGMRISGITDESMKSEVTTQRRNLPRLGDR